MYRAIVSTWLFGFCCSYRTINRCSRGVNIFKVLEPVSCISSPFLHMCRLFDALSLSTMQQILGRKKMMIRCRLRGNCIRSRLSLRFLKKLVLVQRGSVISRGGLYIYYYKWFVCQQNVKEYLFLKKVLFNLPEQPILAASFIECFRYVLH